MHFFKKILLTAILLLPFITQAQTGELPDKSSTNETQELEQLLELLQEQTSIATKTRLNADYVPGMVTVLHGSDLEDRGVRTVWEALGLVPGVELSIEETGRKQVVVRGIGRTYASGNIQIQLNGASLNTAHIAHANPVMNIPIEQVERIEVIRGHGSAIHGEFALAGVLNVITHKEESKIFVNGGENSSLGAGFMVSYNDEQSPLQMNLNIAGWETDGPDIIAGPDELYYEGPSYIAVSNAPGPTNEMAEDKTAIFSLSYEDFSFTAHLLKEGYGDHFGRNQYLPPDEKRIVTRNEYKTLEIKQNLNINNNWNAELYVGWQEKKQTKDDLYAGPELHYPPDPPPDPSIFYHVDTLYIEKRNNIGVDIKWSDKASHNVLVGFEYVDITVEDELNEYYRSDTNTLIFPWDWIDTDKRRRIISTTLQDEYLIRNDLTITLGLRHDEYNDIDSEISPRIAAVWRKDQNNIYKAQYARAFRPPTFYEMAAAIGDVE
ncbi:MAG TPA: TonB-dependent receptor, partial [Gammaproteobacteria bacterium]